MGYDHQILILNRVRNYQKKALKRGMELRDEMHEALESGKDYNTYRTEWLKDSVIKVFKLLEDCAKDFNNKHPDDRCSSLDLADILNSTLTTLERYTKS